MQLLHHLHAHLRNLRPFRWLLLLWIGLIYVWGVFGEGILSEQTVPGRFLLFTLLMLLHWSLYGINRSRATDSVWWRGCYLAIQTLLIILISAVAYNFTVTFFLYLTLVGEIASQVLSIRMILLEGFACLLLFSMNLNRTFGGKVVPFLASRSVPFSIALAYALPVFILVIGYALQQTRVRAQTQRLLHELEQAHRQLAEDATRIEELTRTTERQRMARELHDTLAQGLAGLLLQLEAVKAHLVAKHEERALEIVTQAMGRARTTLATARSAIDDLRTAGMPSTDLRQALEEETLRFTEATGILCTTHFAPFSSIPLALGESIRRSVAEGLLNIARHAQASQVWVCVTEHEQKLTIEVRDNGIGFDPESLSKPGHYGLLGLRERARLFGGQLVVQTAPGEGTTLRFLLSVERVA
ncbi:sensor histidine kinase YdfH [Ktedonobacter sp. SOSP1-52]|uniref:sensor histidine kinase n=1 Tax=Ktedonobacter sp. SOSP1-52 TaxID=2778366 RepID=UPI00191663C5|nr:sensor histidine kinase [Ktedonobacter sp. SOSP1-52]GHO64073.1 sensor histidine kinase YdfH [Ktedonobacter sp. SOSP1-52]